MQPSQDPREKSHGPSPVRGLIAHFAAWRHQVPVGRQQGGSKIPWGLPVVAVPSSAIFSPLMPGCPVLFPLRRRRRQDLPERALASDHFGGQGGQFSQGPGGDLGALGRKGGAVDLNQVDHI